jgi:hypothetical protein
MALPEDMRDRLSQLEYDLLERDIDKETSQLLREFNEFSTPEGLVVAYADILSVRIYAEREILMGNREFFLTYVMPDVEKREHEILTKLDPYKKIVLDALHEVQEMTSHQSGER